MGPWQQNIEVNPTKVDGVFTQAFLDLVKRKHPDRFDLAVADWNEYLQDKVIGRPRTQARDWKVYEAMGWVGIYRKA